MLQSVSDLRAEYSAFLRDDRVLMTGHSHQAWPDVARDGVIEAFQDAAAHVDDKWGRAAEKANVLKAYVAQYLSVTRDEIALAQNSHELVTRFLSALDWRRRKIVSTDGEFHSMRRQLSRLEEAGVEIVWVPTAPLETLAERLAEQVDTETAALMVSTVLFQSSSIVPHLNVAAAAASAVGAEVLFDAYHGFGVVPNTIDSLAEMNVFVTAGGYKYAQWGEGCCWMRVPPHCELRPVYTGWFSDFAGLDGEQSGRIRYGTTPADRFAGSTYDPISHYRAARVVQFFGDQGLSIEALRARSLTQTAHIMSNLSAFDLVTPQTELRGGFVSVRTARAGQAVQRLRTENILVDSRNDILRIGPAPYTTDAEIEKTTAAVKAVLTS